MKSEFPRVETPSFQISRTSHPKSTADEPYRELAGIIFLAALALYFALTHWRDVRAFEFDSSPRGAVDLCVTAATCGLLYFLCRRAWGWFPAFVAAGVFLAVFAFAPFVPEANQPSAVRAAHHAIRGLLVATLLIYLLMQWVATLSSLVGFAAGLLVGLTSALIPEFALVGAITILAAFFLRWRADGWFGFGAIIVLGLGLALPLAVFFFLPQNHLRLTSPLVILPPLSSIADDFAEQANVVLVAAVLIAAVAAGAALAQRLENFLVLAAFCVLSSALLLWISFRVIPWIEVDRALCGLVLLYLVLTLARMYFRGSPEERRRQSPRLLLGAAAGALIVATPVYMRLHAAGFYQTALAACVLSAILFGELWAWFRLQERARLFTSIASAALLLPGVVILAGRSA